MKHALVLSQRVARDIGRFGTYLDTDPLALDIYRQLGFTLLVGDMSLRASFMFLPMRGIG